MDPIATHHRTVSGGEIHKGNFDVTFVSWLITNVGRFFSDLRFSSIIKLAYGFFPQLRGVQDADSLPYYLYIYAFDFVFKCFKLNIL
jgi:hypothetical protein